jgi:hypothetical protein
MVDNRSAASFTFDDVATSSASSVSSAGYALVFSGELARGTAVEWLVWLYQQLLQHRFHVECNGIAVGRKTAAAIVAAIATQSNANNPWASSSDEELSSDGLRRRTAATATSDDSKQHDNVKSSNNTESADVVVFIVRASMASLYSVANSCHIQDRPLTMAQQFEMTWQLLKEIHVDTSCRRVAPSSITQYCHDDGDGMSMFITIFTIHHLIFSDQPITL